MVAAAGYLSQSTLYMHGSKRNNDVSIASVNIVRYREDIRRKTVKVHEDFDACINGPQFSLP